MTFDYNSFLLNQLYELRDTLALDQMKFEVDSEQAFIKSKDLSPSVIYVLTRNLQNDNSIGVDTQPVQILILAEQNGIDLARSFFSEFAKKYNFTTYFNSDEALWVKQQYSDPVVLSNFNTIQYGYRSVLYMAATLFIMKNVVDLRYPEEEGNLKIDGEMYKALSFVVSYNMTPNTQPVAGDGNFISRSVKSVSTMSITIAVPPIQCSLFNKVLSIMNESDSAEEEGTLAYGGNEDFLFDFYLGDTHFEDKALKLVAVNFHASVNNIPAIELGFLR